MLSHFSEVYDIPLLNAPSVLQNALPSCMMIIEPIQPTPLHIFISEPQQPSITTMARRFWTIAQCQTEIQKPLQLNGKLNKDESMVMFKLENKAELQEIYVMNELDKCLLSRNKKVQKDSMQRTFHGEMILKTSQHCVFLSSGESFMC